MSNRSRNKVEIDTIASYIGTTGNDVEPGQTLMASDSAELNSRLEWKFEATTEQIEQARREVNKWVCSEAWVASDTCIVANQPAGYESRENQK